jgi:ABC-type glycerol-3-phosphate transport system substrate-binding protein
MDNAGADTAPGVSAALQGQKTAKEALDAVATDWQRTLRRAGIGRA